MGVFDVEQPNWGRIAPLTVIGPPEAGADHVVTLPTSAGPLRVSLHAWGARFRLGRERAIDYGILVEQPVPIKPTIARAENATTISAGSLTLEIEHAPFAFTLRDGARVVQRSATDGHFVRRFRLPPLAKVDQGWLMTFDLRSGEPVYGLGEKWGRLDKRGQLLRSYNRDALGVNAEWSYKNAPFAWSPEGWGVFAHTPAPVTHGVGHGPWSQRAYAALIENDSLDVFVLTGRGGAEQVGQYTALTGRAPVPPLWSLGVILSKAYYKTADEILAVARDVRARNMPCDVITFDGRAWQDTDTRFAFEWDPKRYPDPAAVVGQLKALNFKVCVWEYPLISEKNPLHAELAAKGWLIKDRRTGAPYRFKFDPEPFGQVLTQLPDSGLLDFTHPDAYAFWRDKHKALFDIGVDMIKPDFGEQIEDDALASNGETGHALHNVYALLYNRCVYEAAARYSKTGPFLFTRATWSGGQRYPSQWGGDPQADWEGLAASLRGALSWGMTGAPYFATDVGGFYGDTRDAALYVRWAQASVFSAHMRLHGIGAREPWSYGPEAEAAAMAALRLRYRVIPYLRTAMEQSAATGLPVQRAMVLAFPQDRAAWAFENQFMCGDDVLVAPCLNAEGAVEVYLPTGRWRRFPTGETFEGGRVYRLVLTLAEMAVFVRDGRRIPLAAPVAHTGLWPQGPVAQDHWPAS
ncbi:MAG: alpha-xylosidase [Rhodospirillaceae bacterium]|nr:alpha-xylosidase [Rhodospirillaceae bacterium]